MKKILNLPALIGLKVQTKKTANDFFETKLNEKQLFARCSKKRDSFLKSSEK